MSLAKQCLLICLMLFFTDTLLSQDLRLIDCHPFYYGVDAGWCTGFGKSKSRGSGSLFNGISSNARAQSGYAINAQVGYIFNCWSRVEIQYVFLKNTYKWVTDFSGGDIENFTANMHAHLGLINYHLGLAPLFKFACLDPYVTGGIGFACNSLFDIKERTPFGFNNIPADVVFAKIESNTHTNFAAQIGVGIRQFFWKRCLLNLKFNGYYLGTFKSGNTRDVIAIIQLAQNQRIGPYKFRNVWMGSVTLGIGGVF